MEKRIVTPQRTLYYMVGIKQRILQGRYEDVVKLNPMQIVVMLYVLESIAVVALKHAGWYFCLSSDLNFELSKCGYQIKDKAIKNAIKVLKDCNLIGTSGTKNINYRYILIEHDAIESYGMAIYQNSIFTDREIKNNGDDVTW